VNGRPVRLLAGLDVATVVGVAAVAAAGAGLRLVVQGASGRSHDLHLLVVITVCVLLAGGVQAVAARLSLADGLRLAIAAPAMVVFAIAEILALGALLIVASVAVGVAAAKNRARRPVRGLP
jgi:hypothetical protein